MALKNLSLGITAFLDILGFGEKVALAKSERDIRRITKAIRKIQSEFEYNTKNKSTKEVHAIYSKTVLAFSDSVVVNVPLESEMTELEGTFDPIMSELTSFAYAQARCVIQNVFLRGGVDLGWWYRLGPTLVSQSLARAYKAEGEASVPVIAVTDNLYKYLRKHAARENYAKDVDPVKKLFRRYNSDNAKAAIGFWYLDYITLQVEAITWRTRTTDMVAYRSASATSRAEMRESGYQRNTELWLSTHARNIERASRKAPNEHVVKKYRWLADYHNDVAKGFTSKSRCKCKI